jgi:hypothetical protein
MSEENTQTPSRVHAFGRHVVAGLVLLVCAYLLLHLLFHLVIFLATIVAVVVAVIGAVWAIHVIF